MNRWLLLICIVLLYSCEKKKLTTFDEMKSDILLSDSFTDAELEDLAKIVDFFQSRVCEVFNEGNTVDLNDCYDKFNSKDISSAKKGVYLKFIDIVAQRNMYKQIDSATIYQVWRHGRCYPDTLKIPINLSVRVWDGKYVGFLTNTGKKNSLFKEYLKSLQFANDLSPSNIAKLTYDYNEFDINDIKVRLLYAVQYLSINEKLDYRIKEPCL